MATLEEFESDEKEAIDVPVSLGFTKSEAERISSVRELARQRFKKGSRKVNARFRAAWLNALEELETLFKQTS